MRFDDEEITNSERLIRYTLSLINLVLTSTILFLGVNYVLLPIVAASATGLSFFHSVCIMLSIGSLWFITPAGRLQCKAYMIDNFFSKEKYRDKGGNYAVDTLYVFFCMLTHMFMILNIGIIALII